MTARRILTLLAIGSLPLAGRADTYQVAEREVRPATTIRIRTDTREKTLVRNPATYPQIEYIVPQGAEVAAGDLLFRFDMTVPSNTLEETLYQIRQEELQSNQRREVSANEIRILEDQREKLVDQLDLERAKLALRRSLPLAEDVQIAAGRLRVAEKNLETAQEELKKAGDRLDRNLIAPRAFDRAERDVGEKKALLDFARAEHEAANLPASSNTIRVLELKIENAELEIEKLDGEIAKKSGIAGLREEGSLAALELLRKKADETREELEHTRLLAPTNGIVTYTDQLKNILQEGTKPERGAVLLEFPERASIAFMGYLTEAEQPVFQEGDPATIVLNTRPQRPIAGRVHSIRNVPRDVAELHRSLWGEAARTTGIKVYDVALVTDDLPDDVLVGTYGEAVITTAEPRRGPAVPLRYVTSRREDHYLSADGWFEPVKGLVVDGYLLLNDPAWLDRTIRYAGAFAAETQVVAAGSIREFVASGELIPLRSQPVYAPRVRAWDLRLVELIPEDTMVKEGDVIARLESKRFTDRMESRAAELERVRSQRKAEEENLAITKENRLFRLKKEKNILEIRRLEFEIVERSMDVTAYHRSLMDWRIATVRRTYKEKEAAWTEAHAGNVAPYELARIRRDLHRHTLREESARLKFEAVQEGATPVERSDAKLAWIKQQTVVDTLQDEVDTDAFVGGRELARLRARETKLDERMARMEKDLEALNILAPTTGLIRYEKLWDGTGVSKIKRGRSAWPMTKLFTIADTEGMTIRVPIPENFFSRITGGMPVEILIPSVGTERLSGTVDHVEFGFGAKETPSGTADLYREQEPSGEQVFYVRVRIENRDDLNLKVGAAAHVIFPFSAG